MKQFASPNELRLPLPSCQLPLAPAWQAAARAGVQTCFQLIPESKQSSTPASMTGDIMHIMRLVRAGNTVPLMSQPTLLVSSADSIHALELVNRNRPRWGRRHATTMLFVCSSGCCLLSGSMPNLLSLEGSHPSLACRLPAARHSPSSIALGSLLPFHYQKTTNISMCSGLFQLFSCSSQEGSPQLRTTGSQPWLCHRPLQPANRSSRGRQVRWHQSRRQIYESKLNNPLPTSSPHADLNRSRCSWEPRASPPRSHRSLSQSECKCMSSHEPEQVANQIAASQRTRSRRTRRRSRRMRQERRRLPMVRPRKLAQRRQDVLAAQRRRRQRSWMRRCRTTLAAARLLPPTAPQLPTAVTPAWKR